MHIFTYCNERKIKTLKVIETLVIWCVIFQKFLCRCRTCIFCQKVCSCMVLLILDGFKNFIANYCNSQTYHKDMWVEINDNLLVGFLSKLNTTFHRNSLFQPHYIFELSRNTQSWKCWHFLYCLNLKIS